MMIVVTKIETHTVKNDPAVFHRFDAGHIIEIADARGQVPHTHMPLDVVAGQLFRDGNGREMHIGMTAEVAETLGLPFKVIERQAREIRDAAERERGCRKIIRRQEMALGWWMEMSLWNRVRVLVGMDPKF